jgi:hypothetical protein
LALTRLVVKLPANRDFCGTLSLLDIRGAVILGPWPVAGRATDALAARFNNPSRDRRLRYGDTPLGIFALAGIIPTGGDTPFGAPEFGKCGAIALEPKGGEAAIAEANGRFALLIVGGPPARDGCLRSTAGALRASDAHVRELIRALRDAGEVSCDVQEAQSRSKAGKVFVDPAFRAEDPPPSLLSLRLSAPRDQSVRARSSAARVGRATGAIILGVSVSFVTMDAAAAGSASSSYQGGGDAGPQVPATSSATSAAASNALAPGYISNDPAVLRDRYVELKAQKAVFDKLTPTDTAALKHRVQVYDAAINDIASTLPTLETNKSELATNTALAKIGSAIAVIKGLGDMGSVISQLYPETKPVGKAWDMGTGTGEAINKIREGDYAGALTTATKELAPSLVPEKAEGAVEAATSGAAAGHDAATAENESKKVDVIFDAVAALAKASGLDDVEATAKAAKAGKAVGEAVSHYQEAGDVKEQLDQNIDHTIRQTESMINRLEGKDDSIKSVLNAPKSSDNDIDDELRAIETKVPGIDEATSAEVDDRASSIYDDMKHEAAIEIPAGPY